jgi:type II secretory pathway component PulF
MLMAMGSTLLAWWPLIVGAVAAAAAGLYFWFRTKAGRWRVDGLLLTLPVVGNLLNKLYQGRSFRSIATLVDVGVPLSDVLALTGNMSANRRYREMWDAVQTAVTNGEHIAAPMAAYPMIPEPVRQMIDCGDRAGRLGPVFDRLAGFIEEEYDQAMKNVCQLLEPALIVVIGGVIGFVAIALLLPLFRSASVAAS